MDLAQVTVTGYTLLQVQTMKGIVKESCHPECPVVIEWREREYDSEILPESFTTIPRVGQSTRRTQYLLVQTNDALPLQLEKPADAIYENTLDGIVTDADDQTVVMQIGKEEITLERKELAYNVKRSDSVRSIDYITFALKAKGPGGEELVTIRKALRPIPEGARMVSLDGKGRYKL